MKCEIRLYRDVFKHLIISSFVQESLNGSQYSL